MMLNDRYGNPLSTNSTAARDAYVRAVDSLLAATPGTRYCGQGDGSGDDVKYGGATTAKDPEAFALRALRGPVDTRSWLSRNRA